MLAISLRIIMKLGIRWVFSLSEGNRPGHVMLHEFSYCSCWLTLQEKKGLSNERHTHLSRWEFSRDFLLFHSSESEECNEEKNSCRNGHKQWSWCHLHSLCSGHTLMLHNLHMLIYSFLLFQRMLIFNWWIDIAADPKDLGRRLSGGFVVISRYYKESQKVG